jgi:hypothetical protein
MRQAFEMDYAGVRLRSEVEQLIDRGIAAVDHLYAAGYFKSAEDADAMLEDFFQELEWTAAELEAESWDVRESGIEDYEVDESVDEGYIGGSTMSDYWEPHMLVASDGAVEMQQRVGRDEPAVVARPS